MTDAECVVFLQWALPRLRMRWPGFRKVRGQVRKRIERRMRELAAEDVAGYRSYLADHPGEWTVLDQMCRITISRFHRDRHVFDSLAGTILPRLARRGAVHCWSAGCCSGEEAYSLQILWQLRLGFPGELTVIATDADPSLIERAYRGIYAESALKEMPPDLVAGAFDPLEGGVRLKEEFRHGVEFKVQDIRETMPDGQFDLILCRNLVFTYYEDALQAELLKRLVDRLADGGVLVVGRREILPQVAVPLVQEQRSVHRRTGDPTVRRLM